MPAQQQAGPSGREPTQDLVGLLAKDGRVLERAPQLEERDVEDDRHQDQQKTRRANVHLLSRQPTPTGSS